MASDIQNITANKDNNFVNYSKNSINNVINIQDIENNLIGTVGTLECRDIVLNKGFIWYSGCRCN